MSLSSPTPSELKLARRQLGLTQAQFADTLGMSTRGVEEWEAGRRQAPPHFRWALAALMSDLEPWGVLLPAQGQITPPT